MQLGIVPAGKGPASFHWTIKIRPESRATQGPDRAIYSSNGQQVYAAGSFQSGQDGFQRSLVLCATIYDLSTALWLFRKGDRRHGPHE